MQQNDPDTPTDTLPLLSASGLERQLPDGSTLFSDVDIRLDSGELVSIQGDTGSGKTMLLRMLAGLDAPSAGRIEMAGRDIEQWAMPEYRARVLYLHQNPVLFSGSVEDNLRAPFAFKVRTAHARFDLPTARRLLGAAGRADGFLQASSRDLSGGERQIVALTRALLCQPSILLLDEPTAALDPSSQEAVEQLVTDWIEGAERTVLWVTHDAAQADRLASRRLRLADGTLHSGSS